MPLLSPKLGGDGLIEGDIADLDPKHLRQPIDLYWASSPCQDLSLAGQRKGLQAERSGLFYAWMAHVADAAKHGFAPRILAFENVTGLITSGQGQDFQDVAAAFQKNGYRFGALEIDARWFLPQSRPRVFMIGLRKDIAIPSTLVLPTGEGPFHSPRLATYHAKLPSSLRKDWVWWNLSAPKEQAVSLTDIVDLNLHPDLDKVQVNRMFEMMDRPSQQRIEDACALGGLHIGTIYKRGRPDVQGHVRQRAEVRMDGLAGCLRTPGGGSSRQTLLIIQDGEIRMRLLSPREAVRLMGLDDSYRLPESVNEAYKLAGDGVAVPVVKHLNANLFVPLLAATSAQLAA